MSTRTTTGPMFDSCDHCGRSFSDDVRYPITVHEDGDSLTILSFCDERCQRAWNAAD